MPAVRKPTAVLEAAGSLDRKKTRYAYRKREPNTGRGIGPAPDRLPDDERAIWDEIVSDLAPGVLQSSDRGSLAALVQLEAEKRRDAAGFGGRKWMVWLALIRSFGMTPADRSRVAVQADGEETGKAKVGLAVFR